MFAVHFYRVSDPLQDHLCRVSDNLRGACIGHFGADAIPHRARILFPSLYGSVWKSMDLSTSIGLCVCVCVCVCKRRSLETCKTLYAPPRAQSEPQSLHSVRGSARILMFRRTRRLVPPPPRPSSCAVSLRRMPQSRASGAGAPEALLHARRHLLPSPPQTPHQRGSRAAGRRVLVLPPSGAFVGRFSLSSIRRRPRGALVCLRGEDQKLGPTVG
jgi:hypothetical protein